MLYYDGDQNQGQVTANASALFHFSPLVALVQAAYCSFPLLFLTVLSFCIDMSREPSYPL